MLENLPLPRLQKSGLSFNIILYGFVLLLHLLGVFLLSTLPFVNRFNLLAELPSQNQNSSFWLLLIAATLSLFCGAWVLLLKFPSRSLLLYTGVTASNAVMLFSLIGGEATVIYLILGATLCGCFLLLLGLLFPYEINRFRAQFSTLPLMLLAALMVGVAVLALEIYGASGKLLAVGLFGVGVLAFVILLFLKIRLAPTSIDRNSAVWMTGIGLFLLVPEAFGLIWHQVRPAHTVPYLLISVSVLFPFSAGFILIRQFDPNISAKFTVTLSRLLLNGLIIFAFILLVAGAGFLVSPLIPFSNPWWMAATAVILALIFNPVRLWFQNQADRVFSARRPNYRTALSQFIKNLGEAPNLAAILQVAHKQIIETLETPRTHIFIFDPFTGQYATEPGIDATYRSELRFSPDSALIRALQRRKHEPLFIHSSADLPTELAADQARLALLSAQALFPMHGQMSLIGWIAVAPRLSGKGFDSYDLDFVKSIAGQTSLAIERQQATERLEQRARETDVLANLAKGINITLDFDHLLELIYAQTTRMIEAGDFYITLKDQESGRAYYAFCLEDDERLAVRENNLLVEDVGLDQSVLLTGRPILTADYLRECRQRGVFPASEHLYAWIGVPLSSGDEIIGVISLGSRNPEEVYTPEQMRLVQAIADQTSGAMIKARLLKETEERARQLATLNDIARVLGSVLDIDVLLKRVLTSAVEILGCEAGTLFLIDEESRDLIFTVTAGPVAQNLVGQRLPVGTGLVGRAVESRGPVVVNDVLTSHDWFARPDEQTGFHTQSLLVFPMIVKDEVVGVIEVINKRNHLPFTLADQDLLQAFAAQAAVAYENARLYTMTDQELAERVEELSVMQRIDRELNASLDVERAMRITLDWAMRQSRSDAGMIGVVEENTGVRVVASQGYASEESSFPAGYLPDGLPAVQRARETGQPQKISSLEISRESVLFSGAESQSVIPIRRETLVIGVLLLESRSTRLADDEVHAFLARLCDHAAIAISNAQLYTAVQQANQAKSEFVSMVSHELKTPMTSIRGYTDLLAAGAVGQINEAQGNFLNTIRSNVDRMQILVSDLTDVARIEAGRLRLEYRAESVSEIIQEVIRSSRQMLAEKEQELVLEISADLPRVWGDRGRLIQVLVNLVSNANKYSPEGARVTIFAEHVPNRWDPAGVPRVIHLAVKDNGYGINAQAQKRIFQKFFRAEEQEIRNSPGTGLGLNITRYLVEIQGGRIWFESLYGHGTTFHFTIPVAEEA